MSAAAWSRRVSSRPTFISTSRAFSTAFRSEKGDLDEAIAEAAKAKRGFTPEDVHARATRTLEKAILQGTTHMRTHLEVDPGVGLRSLEGVLPLIKEYAWAIDLQICVFPQEGLLNNPGTDELLVQGLEGGCRAIGGAPYVDSDPPGQIDRIFELARELRRRYRHASRFRPDRRRHGPGLMSASAPRNFSTAAVSPSAMSPRRRVLHMPEFEAMAKRLADAGVALTVLPSTDLYSDGPRPHSTTIMSPAALCRRTSYCSMA